MAVSDRLPAVTGQTGVKRGGGEGPRRPEALRTGLVIRPKNGDLGRSARLPAKMLQEAPILLVPQSPSNMKKYVETVPFEGLLTLVHTIVK